MVKQKIVIKVNMPCDKCRAKALTLVAGAYGVISVGITGDCRDRLEIVGEDVDAVCLVSCLRKKLCFVEILLVEEVKEKKAEEKKPEKPPCCPGYPYCNCYPIRPPPMVVCETIRALAGCPSCRQLDPASSCCIM